MTPRRPGLYRQPYKRERGGLAHPNLFPRQSPALPESRVEKAIKAAFKKAALDRVGEKLPIPSTPEAWVEKSLMHIKAWADPILEPYLFSLCTPGEVFSIDTIPYERQLHRMRIGLFYQHLIRELMRVAQGKHCNIQAVFDGFKEADLVADVRTPADRRGLRLYLSVKKHSQTVGGQDFGGVVTRIEDETSGIKNVNSPYLCVFAYGNLTGGRLRSYEKSRKIRYKRTGEPYSENCECWEPGFVFPYVSGWSPIDIYKLAGKHIQRYLHFYTVEFREQCSKLLTDRLQTMGLIDKTGNINRVKYLEYTLS